MNAGEPQNYLAPVNMCDELAVSMPITQPPNPPQSQHIKGKHFSSVMRLFSDHESVVWYRISHLFPLGHYTQATLES